MPMTPFKALVPAALLAMAICGWAQAGLAIQASASGQSTNPARSITVPSDTSVLGKLLTNLDAAQAKAGDAVDVQISEDIKSGHDVLVKKGSTLNGHVSSVQQGSKCVIGILFDRVTLKNGDQFSLNLSIQALAPQSDVKSDSLMTGRGMAQNTADATVTGHSGATSGSVDALDHKSTGVYAMPGVSLAIEIANGQRISLVVSTSGNIRLKKGAQLLMQAVSQ
jgi:uncharacterized cupredoxin-like copper-binding protein